MFSSIPGRASIMTFSGIDANPGDMSVRIDHPNSDAALAHFLPNLTGVGTEDFENLTPGPISSTLTFPGAGTTATLTGSVTVQNVPTGTDSNGHYPISGNQYLEDDAPSFSLSFSQPVDAFGFYGVDIGDMGGILTLQLANGSSTSLMVPSGPIPAEDNSSVLYFGFYGTTAADEFTSITFTNSNTADGFAFDDMSIGTFAELASVPEPGSLTLLALGVAGLFGYRWHRRRTTGA
ncbi:MAG TPA: PEP-CTERM sorting domain-containing protein [Terriglobia bacterium]